MFWKSPYFILRILAFCIAVTIIGSSVSYASAPPETTNSRPAVADKFNEVVDVYSAFDALTVRGEALEIKGLAKDGSTLVVSWDGYEPVLSSNGVVYEDLVVTHVSFGGQHDLGVGQIIVEQLPSLGGSFRAVFSVDSDGNLVAQISSLIDTNGVRIAVNVADGTVVAVSTCVCFGTTAGGTTCTNTQCDESEVCLTDAGGASLKHCRHTAGQEISPTRPISAVIIQFR